MKKLFIARLAVFSILAFLLFPVLAQALELINPIGSSTFEELIQKIVNFLAFRLAPPIAVIMIIVAGYYFVTSMGEPTKIQTAKQIILWVCIGLLVLFCASGIIKLLKDILGVRASS